jgi:hypothetical protein
MEWNAGSERTPEERAIEIEWNVGSGVAPPEVDINWRLSGELACE